jgi:hypothetical protein
MTIALRWIRIFVFRIRIGSMTSSSVWRLSSLFRFTSLLVFQRPFFSSISCQDERAIHSALQEGLSWQLDWQFDRGFLDEEIYWRADTGELHSKPDCGDSFGIIQYRSGRHYVDKHCLRCVVRVKEKKIASITFSVGLSAAMKGPDLTCQ